MSRLEKQQDLNNLHKIQGLVMSKYNIPDMPEDKAKYLLKVYNLLFLYLYIKNLP